MRHKQPQITSIITGQINQINTQSPAGPALHFYHRVMDLRRHYPDVSLFLASDACIEMLYATLLSWDMNSRRAKMKDYADFKSNLQGNAAGFRTVAAAAASFTWASRAPVIQSFSALFDTLELMKTNEKVVSNSKCMHFVFPELCVPVDNSTFEKLYGTTSKDKGRFLEVLDFSYDILAGIQNPQQYLDPPQNLKWNTCVTKLVDNAIILL